MTEQSHVVIYTDGACNPNPGPGAWAVLLRFGDREKEIVGSDSQTTNNRMELMAAIQGLRAFKRACCVDLYTDLEYLKHGITEWLPGWRKRGWKRKEGVLKNADLWQELDACISQHQVSWHWVRGHVGNVYNERVDCLARRAIPQP